MNMQKDLVVIFKTLLIEAHKSINYGTIEISIVTRAVNIILSSLKKLQTFLLFGIITKKQLNV